MKITYHKEDDMDFDPVRESKGVDCATGIVIIALCAVASVSFFIWLIWG